MINMDVLKLEVDISGVWTNVLGPTHEIRIKRAPLDVSTLTATVLDSVVDPTVAATIRPGIAMRLQAYASSAWTNVFLGHLTGVSVSYKNGVRVSLEASDDLSKMANQGEPRGVADIDELPYLFNGKGLIWNVNGSGAAVGSATVVTTNENASVLDQVILTRDSNLGYAWIDRNNVVQVWDAGALSTAAVATFSDTTGLSFSDIDVSFDLTSCINDVTVAWMRPNDFTNVTEEVIYGPFQDGTSIATWGPRTASYRVHGFTTEAEVSAFATSILTANATPVVRVNSLTTPVRSQAEVDDLATIDLYDPVSVTHQGTTYTDLRVSAIEHSIEPDKWVMSIEFTGTTSSAPPQWTPQPPPQPVTQQAGSDGLPPTTSPTPVVESGIKSLHVTWDQITNPDVVTYDVHISTSSGFTPSSGTYAGSSTGGTYFWIGELPGGTPLAYSTTYYVRIVTSDKDGTGPVGAQASGTVTPVITATEITDASISTPKLQTNAVTTDKLAANAITAGKIQAGAIDGMTITGATIQTASSGQRMSFSGSGYYGQNEIKFYSGSGSETIAATIWSDDATTGGTGSPWGYVQVASPVMNGQYAGYIQLNGNRSDGTAPINGAHIITGAGSTSYNSGFLHRGSFSANNNITAGGYVSASSYVSSGSYVSAPTIYLGSGSISRIVFGDNNVTTDSSGIGYFYHGLGVTPTAFMVTSRIVNRNITVSTKTSSYVQLYVRLAADNSVAANISQSFEYIAIY